MNQNTQTRHKDSLKILLEEFQMHIQCTFEKKLKYIGTTTNLHRRLERIRDIDLLVVLEEINEGYINYFINIINKLHNRYNILLDARIYSSHEIKAGELIPSLNKYLLKISLRDIFGKNPFAGFNVSEEELKQNCHIIINEQANKVRSIVPRVITSQYQLKEISQYAFDALRAFLILAGKPTASKEAAYNLFTERYPEFPEIKEIYNAYIDPGTVINVSGFVVDVMSFIKHLKYKVDKKETCKKVLLINTPSRQIPHPSDNSLKFDNNMPLGLVYVGTYLKKMGIDVEILDAYAENLGAYSTIDRIFSNGKIPLVIGLNSSSPNIHIVHKIADFIKRIYPDVQIVVGGPHASIAAEHTLSNSNIDYIVKGEGEIPFYNLVSRLFNDGKVDAGNLPKAVLKKGYNNFGKEIETVNAELDSIPCPDFSLLPLESRYFQNKKRLYIHTTRGCSYNCIYCSVPRVWKKVREMPIEKLLDDIEELNARFAPEEYQIVDDNFSHKRGEMIRKFCAGLEKRKIKIKWKCQVRADFINIDLIEQMGKAGCFEIDFGIESGNAEIQKFIRKGLSLEKIPPIIEAVKRNGIASKAFMMLGFPNEKYSHIADTINYALKLKEAGLDGVAFFPVMPFPGTEIAQLTNKKFLQGAIIDDSVIKENTSSNFKLRKYSAKPEISLNRNFSPDELRFLVKFAYQIFENPFEIKNLKKEFSDFVRMEEKEIYGV
jgi:radical SAM superfamily enzyme YgiQ (UPF0313 family)